MDNVVLLNYFHSNEQDLLVSLGRFVMIDQNNKVFTQTKIDREKAILAAKAFLNAEKEKFRLLICEKHQIQKKIYSEEFDSISALIIAIAEIIAPTTGTTIGTIVATYLVKKGLSELCLKKT